MADGSVTTRPWDWLPALLVPLLLAAFAFLGWQLRGHATPVAFFDSINVEASETPRTLGWEDLGQHEGPRSASKRHLLVDRRDGTWVIGNRSQSRRVFVRTSKYEARYLQRWPLRAGDKIVLAEAAFEVEAAGDARLVLRDVDTGRRAAWDDGSLAPSGEPVHDVCRSLWSRLVLQLRWLFRNIGGDARPELPLFSIGGGLNCSNRWKLPQLQPESIAVLWHAGRFWLSPGGRRFDVLMARENGPQVAFTDLILPIDGPEGRIERIILGRTNYEIDANADRLILKPVANMDLWFEEVPQGSVTRLSWSGAGLEPVEWLQAQRLWLLPGIAAVVALIFGAVIFWSTRRHTIRPGWVLGVVAGAGPAIMGGWVTVLMLRGSIETDAMLRVGAVWLAWTWASLVMIVARRLVGVGGWVWFAAVFLAGSGTIVLLQLGAGAENTRWMSFIVKHTVILTLFGWTVAILAVLPGMFWRRVWLWIFDKEVVPVLLGAFLVVMMMVQLAVGTEEGIGGIQPVEFTKTVFVILLAFVGMHFTEIRRRDTRAYRLSPIFFLLPFLRFIGIFLLVVFSLILGVRDFSPAIILSLVTLAWIWKIGSSQGETTGAGLWFLLRPAVILVFAVIIGAGSYARSNPASLPDGMPQRDRVMVWAEPDLHPHSGSQVLGAMDRVGEGKWLGEVAWFGDNGKVMDLPAVQDDFITAFFLHRFGGYAGLTLVGFQLLYLLSLFALARRIEAFTAAGDFSEQGAGIVLGFTIFGLAWMQVAHWLIAWSNTLGLLPVMGQPMTWMSAGNSHLLGFALFSLTIALITGWVLRVEREET